MRFDSFKDFQFYLLGQPCTCKQGVATYFYMSCDLWFFWFKALLEFDIGLLVFIFRCSASSLMFFILFCATVLYVPVRLGGLMWRSTASPQLRNVNTKYLSIVRFNNQLRTGLKKELIYLFIFLREWFRFPVKIYWGLLGFLKMYQGFSMPPFKNHFRKFFYSVNHSIFTLITYLPLRPFPFTISSFSFLLFYW